MARKTEKMNVRITPEIKLYIAQLPGRSWADKLNRMVLQTQNNDGSFNKETSIMAKEFLGIIKEIEDQTTLLKLLVKQGIERKDFV